MFSALQIKDLGGPNAQEVRGNRQDRGTLLVLKGPYLGPYLLRHPRDFDSVVRNIDLTIFDLKD